jgi:predicted AAA+ superfamily ATPase
MLLEQSESFWMRDLGIERTCLQDLEKASSVPYAVIVSGLRRVGKSTLLAQLAHRLGQDRYYYVNFEDERFIGFQAYDANDLYQYLLEIFGERKIFIVDEIQNIPGWEHFVRRFMDLGFKFFISGSNASLLSSELGTRLTGRYVSIELFPFSYYEYLVFRGEVIPEPKKMATVQKARLEAALRDYLRSGGIPDALKYPDLGILRTLYDDVLYRDIATRYRLDAIAALKELAFTLISGPANLVSYNKLKQQLGLGSINTVKSYIDYMQDSWLLFTTNRYDYSLKRQQIAPKKVYSIDTGLSHAVGFGFSSNSGKDLENLVFLALRRRYREVYYYVSPSGYEVDFYLPEERRLIQVCENLANLVTRDRETRALQDALSEIKVNEAMILTDSNEEATDIQGVPLKIQSVAEWLITA